jgi:hypothetical protein
MAVAGKWRWWKIYNLDELNKVDVPDVYLSLNLDGLGLTDIVVMRGFNISVLFLGYVLTPFLNDRNGFSMANKVSAYIDEENNLWVGQNESNL